MSVDKFGRHINVFNKEIVKGLKGEGFHLTDDGDYDIGKKLLRNVADPLVNSDAATKGYVDLQTQTPTKTEDVWKFQNKRLGDVANPQEATDAATKQYVDSIVPEQSVDNWSFKGKRLSNTGDPVYDGETVNVRYLKKYSVHFEDGGDAFDIRNRRLKRVGEPIEESDAVTLKFLKTQLNDRTTQDDQKDMIKRLGLELYKYINSKKSAPKPKNESPLNYINWDFVLGTSVAPSTGV